ncbi:calcium/sodium antiporter [Candidatus Woesearchaeota archaeon]|nr:calcium/sodium antiporter [Candidatus Woesearchaeota archaeon]
MLVNIVLLLLGLILLVKGSNLFVKAASTIAKKFGVSEFIIGLTLIAIGTSLPELISAIFASVKRESGLIMGNIIGANITNISLIIGIAAVIAVLKTKKHMLERDGYFLLFSVIILFIAIIDGKISGLEGVFFVTLYIAYTFFLFEKKPELKRDLNFRDFITYFYKFQYITTIRSKLLSNFKKDHITSKEKRQALMLFEAGVFKDIIIIIFSGVLVIIGAEYLVNNAVFFANILDVPETIMGIFIAIGTTMPELSVAIAASRKNLGNIIIGNAIGSCLTNIFLILGISALIFPITVTKLTLWYIVPFLAFLSILLIITTKSDWEIRKREGILFIVLYALFLLFILHGAVS